MALRALFTNIANAIRSKTNDSSTITAENFPVKILDSLVSREYYDLFSELQATSFRSMFSYYKGTVVPQILSGAGTDFTYTFQTARNLTTIRGIDFTSCTSELTYTFYNAVALQNLTVNGTVSVNLSLASCKLLSAQSMLSVYNALVDNTLNCTELSVTLPGEAIDRFDAYYSGVYDSLEQMINQNKGWTAVRV